MDNQHSEALDAFDRTVRAYVYDHFITKGVAPSIRIAASALSSGEEEMRAAFGRLAAGRVFVLQENGEILMANPFSAVPTPFVVEAASGKRWWGNCIWDGVGVLAMLGQDGKVSTGCGDCNDAMSVEVAGGKIADSEGIVHFSVPAAKWWQNIKFT